MRNMLIKILFRYLAVPMLLILHFSGMVRAETGCEKRERLLILGDNATYSDGKRRPGSPYCVPYNWFSPYKCPYGCGLFQDPACIWYGIDLLDAEIKCGIEKTARAGAAAFTLIKNTPNFIQQITNLTQSIQRLIDQIKRDLPAFNTQINDIKQMITRKDQGLGGVNKIIDFTGQISDFVAQLAQVAAQVPPIIIPLIDASKAGAEMLGAPGLIKLADDFQNGLVITDAILKAFIELQPEVKKMGPSLKGLVKSLDDMFKSLSVGTGK